MYGEVVKTIKTVLLAVILLAMFKIYENGGYANPITIAVLIIMFSLWILFRIELNEEVLQEITSENNSNKEVHTPPHSSCAPSYSSTPPRKLKSLPLGLVGNTNKRENKRISKFRALVRSKSKSPDQNNNFK
jgi:hypothetical protein